MLKPVTSHAAALAHGTLTAARLPRLDQLFWMALAAALLLWRAWPTFGPALSADSLQYFSIAQNMLRGLFGYSSLVHYDVERSFGVLPAPVVTFALGYPALVAAVSLAGVSVPAAALAIGVGSTVASVPVLAWLSRLAGLSRAIANVVIGCFVLNGAVIEYGGAALSEPPFGLLVLLGTALLLEAGSRRKRMGSVWALAGAAFAAAYLVRYPGLFFIVGLGVLALRHLLVRDFDRARGHMLAIAVAMVAVLAAVARNLALVGNWHGRDDMLVSVPVGAALGATAQAVNALLLGAGTGTAGLGVTFFAKALLVLCAVGGTTLLAWCWMRDRNLPARTAGPAAGRRNVTVDTLLLVLTYGACMFYAGLTSSISYGSARNFVPIAGLLFLLLGCALQAGVGASRPQFSRSIGLTALAACAVLYAYLNALVLMRPPHDVTAAVRSQLDFAEAGKPSARTAIGAIAGAGGTLVAINGQLVGYVLEMPTVSLVTPAFSTVTWDEKTLRETMRRFGARALVVTPQSEDPDNHDSDLPSLFLRRLARGETPDWLRLAAQSGRVQVYVPQ